MNSHLFLSIAALSIASPAIAAEPVRFDRAALMRDAAQSGFEDAEQTRLTAAAAGDEAAIVELGQFYMAHALWVEALAAFDRLDDAQALSVRSLVAECDYEMGRDRAIVALMSEDAKGSPLLAMALTRLGAYAEASALFKSDNPLEPPPNRRHEFHLAMAEAFAMTGDDAASAALDRAGLADGDAETDARRDFILALIRKSKGDAARADHLYRRAAAEDGGEWSMRARLALAAMDGDADLIERLSLEWRGGAFERERRLAIAGIRLAGGDFDRGFAALTGIVDRSPEADAAMEAQDLIAAALPRLFDAQSALHPKDAARLFFEHVEFAPPGAEGDALIRQAADRLSALGLYRQAAMLLDHQTFKRLRGVDRARVAADLAETLMLAGDAREALRVIRSTRIAGLSDDVNKRRRKIEARALAASGDEVAAVAMLADAVDRNELLLRAEINWTRRAWAEAARDYASYVVDLASLDQAADRDAAVRGATAFLLAGDRAGYRAFSMETSKRLEGAPEARLIETLGDVDGDRFLSGIMDSYKTLYGPSKR